MWRTTAIQRWKWRNGKTASGLATCEEWSAAACSGRVPIGPFQYYSLKLEQEQSLAAIQRDFTTTFKARQRDFTT
jgi:hypothetical protein